MEKELTKFVLFTTQRTGSSYISRYLNNHPNVRMHGEILIMQKKDGLLYFTKNKNRLLHSLFFTKHYKRLNKYVNIPNPVINKYTRLYVEALYENKDRFYTKHNTINTWLNEVSYDPLQHEEHAAGFKLMYSQLSRFPYLRDWIKKENISIIYLKRENLLKQYLSNVANKKTKVAHSDKKADIVSFTVDVEQCLQQIQKTEKENAHMQQIFAGNQQLTITYENFFSDMEQEGNKIFQFLGVSTPQIQKPKMVKRSSNKLNDIIENYDELTKRLENTAYAQYLV